MIKIFISDDNPMVLESLCKSIDWKKNNLDLVGYENNGKNALECVLEKRPDIIITDIRMPGLSGIEFIKALAKTNYNPKIIIISAYKDFEYAQKALSLGVKEYIVKPINNEELLASVLNISEELQLQKSLQSSDDMGRIAKMLLKQNKLIKRALENNSDLDKSKISYKLCSILIAQKTEEDRLFAFAETLKLKERRQIVVTTYKDYPIIVVMGNSAENIINIVESFESVVKNSFIISDVIKIEETLYYSANKVLSMLESKIIREKFLVQIDESSDDDKKNSRKTIADYSILLSSCKSETVDENFEEFIKFLLEESLDNTMAIGENINLFLAFFLKDISDKLVLIKSDYESYQHIKDEKFLSAKIEKLLNFIKDILNKKAQSTTYSRNVRFALSYIDKNLDHQVSLTTVASLCSVSPAYLSSIVKKETGVNFVDLVNKKKIQKSLDLMKNTSLNMDEISRVCGFSDYAYFFQVFKKYMGISPKTYTNQNT